MADLDAMDAVSWLFLDVNAYFATLEQEMQPELRGLPIAVVPVEADSTCCIAISYQAKAYGVKTGMAVREAKRMCPHLRLVNARPKKYVEYHHRIRHAIERYVPVQQVLSCDEFAVRLKGRECEPSEATALAYAIKQSIREVGTTLRCSIGVGPNRLLAKIAGEMQRPDGLMLLQRRHLPQSLYSLALRDIPGVGYRMEKRLIHAGIESVEALCALSRHQMRSLWGGVPGERLWLWLRGEDFMEPGPGPAQSLSWQHILPPACRNPERAKGIALKMLHSVATRLRRKSYWACGIFIQVGLQNGRAAETVLRFPPTQDTLELQDYCSDLWHRIQGQTPTDVLVALTDLQPAAEPGLFAEVTVAPGRTNVMAALDGVNRRFGQNTVYLGSIHRDRREAPTRISFGPPPQLEEF